MILWDNDKAELELKRRLTGSKTFRKIFESDWEDSERSLYNTKGAENAPDAGLSFDSELDLGLGDIDSGNQTVGVNYMFKNYRFIHSQLSANPPTVVARPTTSDPADRRKADAADRLIRHAIRAESMQENVDRSSGKTLLYGTGWMKTFWNPHKGDIVGRDEKTGEFTLEGKIDIYSPSTWDVWIDPDARVSEDIRYIFERRTIPLDEAVMMWPEREEIIRAAAKKLNAREGVEFTGRPVTDSELVEVYEYWERGLPINGMLGRYAICLEDGQLVEPVKPSPFSFSPPAEDGEKPMPTTAGLPYHSFTDIDVIDEVYGKSFTEFEAPIQEIINRIDSVDLDNAQAHGVARLILPEGAEIAEGSISNSPWDIIKIKGNQGPFHLNPPTIMPQMSQLRDRLKSGGDDMAGVNEAMFGEMSRETSGFSLQYATNQGNMIRRRLFNKYVLFVEEIYNAYLNLVRKYWDDSRVIHVLGKEKAFEAIDIKGSDIDGGYGLVVEYGASLSLDPSTRREELLQLMPLFEKAGVDNKTILSMMKLNDLEGLYDIMQLAGERQSEIFTEMVASDKYIAPRELEEHQGMLEYAYRYLMTAEFKHLEEDQKILIETHVKEREQLAAAGAGVEQAAGAPGPAPDMAEMPPQTTEGGLIEAQPGTPAAPELE